MLPPDMRPQVDAAAARRGAAIVDLIPGYPWFEEEK
jgi:hypothetical protein